MLNEMAVPLASLPLNVPSACSAVTVGLRIRVAGAGIPLAIVEKRELPLLMPSIAKAKDLQEN